MTSTILQHYDTSPYAEKECAPVGDVRTVAFAGDDAFF